MQPQKSLCIMQEYHWKFIFSISTSDFFPSNIKNDFIKKIKQVKDRYQGTNSDYNGRLCTAGFYSEKVVLSIRAERSG